MWSGNERVNSQVIEFLLKHLNGLEDVVDLSAESPKMLSGLSDPVLHVGPLLMTILKFVSFFAWWSLLAKFMNTSLLHQSYLASPPMGLLIGSEFN